MTNIRAIAMQHVGRLVVVHCKNVVHRGVLHHVDEHGMYLRVHQPVQTVSSQGQGKAELLGDVRGTQRDISAVFFPLLFIPFLAALAIAPWAYGGYYGGYGPGYW